MHRCYPAPRGRRGRGSGFPTVLTLTLFLIFVLPGWMLFCRAGVFLTSAARSGGEVRKTEAERLERHPARPAAVAAGLRGRTGPARVCGPLGGPRAGRVRPVCGPGRSRPGHPGDGPMHVGRDRMSLSYLRDESINASGCCLVLASVSG